MRSLLFVFALCLGCTTASAATVKDLYRGQVDVASRSNQDRQLAIRDAMAQVLIRISGDKDILQHDASRSMVRQADQYLLSYSYRGAAQLQVDFDKDRIQRQLQQAHLPVWGAQRPQTLVWLAAEDPSGERGLVGENDELGRALTDQAQITGLPLTLPLLDLEDSMAMQLNDVWGNFPSPVLDASERYGADFIVSGRLAQFASEWQFMLLLYPPASTDGSYRAPRPLLRRSGSAATETEALEAMLAELAKYYSQRYAAVASDEAGHTQLVFELAGGIEQLVALERYLTSLTPVKAVQISQVSGREVVLELDLIGGINEVEQLMALDQRISTLPVDDVLNERARYRWQARSSRR
ncbi:DUF2066 domain-containing protein [Ferrimonas pelagia]|uniref:DUF2066 domain-containing protein n=1 Tax=Ferrimonas pelagia TaxID=1177826 RepID=UPI0031EE0B99